MSQGTSEGPGPRPLEILDELADGRLACRVCGALIPSDGDYAGIHWDWHEAANGA